MALAVPPIPRDTDIGVVGAGQLTASQCQDIIKLHKDSQNPFKEGRIQQETSFKANKIIRDVNSWIIHENHDWVDSLLIEAAQEANTQFGFNLTGMIERPQLLQYQSPSHGYDWHLDIGNGDNSTRKISISIALSPDTGYEGGELCMFTRGETSIKLTQGLIAAFPSFMPHRVKPVTTGERWALVCWIHGEPFR